MKRTVYFISDGTAITAQVLGHAVMSQFPVEIEQITIPFIENIIKAQEVSMLIDKTYHDTHHKPIVFYSIVNPDIAKIIEASQGFCQNIVQMLVTPLQQELGIAPHPITHGTHGLTAGNLLKYDARIAAIDYTLAHDDGISLRNLEQAEVILLGVSRCGKTPTSLYLAMQFGVKAVNYPFTADDMDNIQLPAAIKPFQDKLFGLTIDPERLSAIREERMENSRYASLRQCRIEVAEVEALYRKNNIRYINTTNYSVEEISTKLLAMLDINRQFF